MYTGKGSDVLASVTGAAGTLDFVITHHIPDQLLVYPYDSTDFQLFSLNATVEFHTGTDDTKKRAIKISTNLFFKVFFNCCFYVYFCICIFSTNFS